MTNDEKVARSVWGDDATLNKKSVMAGFEDCFMEWCCPRCGANLSKESGICLNACHLSAQSAARFRKVMKENS